MGLYIGLISGTSIDGVDAALVDVDGGGHCDLVTALDYPIPPELRATLDSLTRPGPNELQRMLAADGALGDLLADAALAVARQGGIAPGQVFAIGSHGQTLRHYPTARYPQSLQIGDPNRIAERTGITTVADLRRRDMAAGGQGAPLVPALHAALLRNTQQTRVVVNLGGIANITVLPAAPEAPVTGWDTGPANTLMDGWIARWRGEDMDRDGAWAASGASNAELLARLLEDPYFALPGPKSTGREYFNMAWLDQVLAAHPGPVAPADVQATLAQLTVASVAAAITSVVDGEAEVVVCGGGSHNRHLMALLGTQLAPRVTVASDERGVPADWVEAMAFGWLAHCALAGCTGTLATVTGARHGVILGGVYPGAISPGWLARSDGER